MKEKFDMLDDANRQFKHYKLDLYGIIDKIATEELTNSEKEKLLNNDLVILVHKIEVLVSVTAYKGRIYRSMYKELKAEKEES